MARKAWPDVAAAAVVGSCVEVLAAVGWLSSLAVAVEKKPRVVAGRSCLVQMPVGKVARPAVAASAFRSSAVDGSSIAEWVAHVSSDLEIGQPRFGYLNHLLESNYFVAVAARQSDR